MKLRYACSTLFSAVVLIACGDANFGSGTYCNDAGVCTTFGKGPAPGSDTDLDGGSARSDSGKAGSGSSTFDGGDPSTTGNVVVDTDAGGIGLPCERDQECANHLCNWQLERCEPLQAINGPCSRDQECAGALCNWQLESCQNVEPPGGPCSRDKECAGSLCNEATEQCE